MNAFLFFRYVIRMLYFFFLFSQSTNIDNRVQIRPILYSSQTIRLQIFFRVSDKGTIHPIFLDIFNICYLQRIPSHVKDTDDYQKIETQH